MRFKGLDLNLLVAFDALMSQQSVTAAACTVNLSQPAMSSALARLRTYFNDELFTMQGRRFLPTPRAKALGPAVRDVLIRIQFSIISYEMFNPGHVQATFQSRCVRFMTLVFFEKVVERVEREAPTVGFELLAPADEPNELLGRGEIDLLILPEQFRSYGHPHARLFDETLVCVGCAMNKHLSQQLSLEKYLSMGHVAAKLGSTQKPTIEEWLLVEYGLKRRIEVVAPGVSLIPPLLSGTERIATIPLRLGCHFAEIIPLGIVEFPVALGAFTMVVQWPALHNRDQASIWMKEILLQEAGRMGAPTYARGLPRPGSV
uniref:NodD2 n=1 Tax=Rhizobium sp. SIN-1 TaxID=133729 RepID=Q9F887_9HYPH|nr:NodD2 [Rhizobium sp. SIN-1]